MTAMAEIQVKTEDKRFTLPDVAALVAAVRSGTLGRKTMVRPDGTDSWVAADSITEVAALFSDDVWSAWEEDADEALLDSFQVPVTPPKRAKLDPAPTMPPQDEVEDLPAAAVSPVDESPSEEPLQKSSDERISAQPITPAETTHPPGPSGPRRPAAKIIAFPQPDEPHTAGSAALKSRPRSFEVQPQSSVRWGPIAIIGSIALAAMLLWVWFVNMHATADFAPRSSVASNSVAPIPPPMTAEEVVLEISPYEVLEDEIREQLMEGLLDIPGEQEFEDALLIELRRVRVDARSIRVKIHSWAGRRQDLPDEVSFNLKVVERDGELDRDLGALGLVLGKYIQSYGIQATEMNIILSSEAGLRKVSMDPETARRYFTHRVSLERFLQSAFTGTQ